VDTCDRCGKPMAPRTHDVWGTGISGRRKTVRLGLCEDCETVDRLSIPRRFVWATLDAPELRARSRESAIEATRAALDKPVVIWQGPSGSGKTSLACAGLRTKTEGMFVSAWALARARSRHPLGEGEPKLVSNAMTTPLLLLDDLGTEGADWGAICDVVLHRHDESLPMWTTTWLKLDEMTKRYGAGFARRASEGATVIACGKAS
jgi:hypothetical protein